MSQKELSETLQSMEKYRKKVTSSKEESRKFLRKLGVLDKNNNVSESYKEVCTPLTQQGRA